MSKLLDVIARHAVASMILLSILLALTGLCLLLRPHWVLCVLRYGLGIGNIGIGLFLLVRTLCRMKNEGKKT